MVGRLLSFWEGKVSGAMLNFRWVTLERVTFSPLQEGHFFAELPGRSLAHDSTPRRVVVFDSCILTQGEVLRSLGKKNTVLVWVGISSKYSRGKHLWLARLFGDFHDDFNNAECYPRRIRV